MANVYNENVWIIDTASASNILAAPNRVRVKHIRWVVTGATAGTTTAEVANGSGTVLWRSIATATNFIDDSAVCLEVREGIRVPTLGGGVLFLYLE